MAQEQTQTQTQTTPVRTRSVLIDLPNGQRIKIEVDAALPDAKIHEIVERNLQINGILPGGPKPETPAAGRLGALPPPGLATVRQPGLPQPPAERTILNQLAPTARQFITPFTETIGALGSGAMNLLQTPLEQLPGTIGSGLASAAESAGSGLLDAAMLASQPRRVLESPESLPVVGPMIQNVNQAYTEEGLLPAAGRATGEGVLALLLRNFLSRAPGMAARGAQSVSRGAAAAARRLPEPRPLPAGRPRPLGLPEPPPPPLPVPPPSFPSPRSVLDLPPPGARGRIPPGTPRPAAPHRVTPTPDLPIFNRPSPPPNIPLMHRPPEPLPPPETTAQAIRGSTRELNENFAEGVKSIANSIDRSSASIETKLDRIINASGIEDIGAGGGGGGIGVGLSTSIAVPGTPLRTIFRLTPKNLAAAKRYMMMMKSGAHKGLEGIALAHALMAGTERETPPNRPQFIPRRPGAPNPTPGPQPPPRRY